MSSTINNAQEDPVQSTSSPSAARKGGYITMPFLLATMTCISLAFGGLYINLEVYLIQEFNINRISAAKIYNVFNSFIFMLPIAAAVLADSFLGCYSVIWISSLISSLGMLLLTLTAAFAKLRPPPCESELCRGPTRVQLSVLYISLAVAILGMAGTRFSVGPMGAHQFDKPKLQEIFFNWFTFIMHICLAVSSTAIVYVQDSVSWAWGYGIPFAANAIGLVVFLTGTRFYRQLKPQGSPFAGLARVLVAVIRNRRLMISQDPGDYFQDHENKPPLLPTKFFRFLNRAALKSVEGDAEPKGLVRKSWKLCTVKEVEDFKSLIKMLPLWSSSLLVYLPLAILSSLAILQALTMDRHLGHNFKIPAATIFVFTSISTCSTIFFIDRVLIPMWNKFDLNPITPLQRIAIGHLFEVLAMAVLALVETERLKIVRMNNHQNQDKAVVPMSIFWLITSLAFAGMGHAFHFPGHIAFFHQEFPKSLKNTSAAIVSLSIGISFYLGNALIEAVGRTTDWLPENINRGRLDNVYWLVTILVGIDFCYFLLCASLYEYRNSENIKDGGPVSDER